MTVESNDRPTPSPDSGSSNNSQPKPQPELVLAKWSTRFWAWLIDFIIVTVAFQIIFAISYPPLAFTQGFNPPMGLQGFNGSAQAWVGGAKYAIQSAMFFAYWIYFESTTGQSIGKRLLKIKTTDMSGNIAGTGSIIIQSFGKAFLLPIDVFFGWIFTNDKRQRLLSRAANTIVIKPKSSGTEGKFVYRKE
jgi:uncharacterized RDD family membrane protein YckC